MLNRIIRFSLQNRLLVLVAAVLLFAGGLYRAFHAEVDVFPDLNAPTVVVMTEAGGMAAEEVEQLVTFPIETAVNGATGVRRVRSSSTTGFSVVWVEFDWGTDIYLDRQIVSEKLATLGETLPENVGNPTLGPQSSILGELLIVGLTADSTSMLDLRTLADWTIRPRLLSTGGVAQVAVLGGDIKEYQVLLHPERMKHYGVTLADVMAVTRDMNRNTNGGVITWANEQAIREIYAKPYELAVKEGNNSAFMTAFNRIGLSTCSTNYALLELLTRGEWGFCGHNVTDYMDYPEYRYTNLMVRAGNELPLGGPNKLIGKGKGGNSSSTEGTWSAELNTVLVAADTASAEAADAARRAGEDASTYETVPSATQYFAVRKAAQRVLYSNANSNAILNGYENHIVEELEYKVGDKFGGWGGGKNIITPLFTARYADVSDIKIVNADAIPGMNLGADGVASGTFNEAGDYTVTATATATVEGWVYVQLTLTIHVK